MCDSFSQQHGIGGPIGATTGGGYEKLRTEVELAQGVLGSLRVEGVHGDGHLVGDELPRLELVESGLVAGGGSVDGGEGLLGEHRGGLAGVVAAAELERLDGSDEGHVLAAEEAEDGAPDGGEEARRSVLDDGGVGLRGGRQGEWPGQGQAHKA